MTIEMCAYKICIYVIFNCFISVMWLKKSYHLYQSYGALKCYARSLLVFFKSVRFSCKTQCHIIWPFTSVMCNNNVICNYILSSLFKYKIACYCNFLCQSSWTIMNYDIVRLCLLYSCYTVLQTSSLSDSLYIKTVGQIWILQGQK